MPTVIDPKKLVASLTAATFLFSCVFSQSLMAIAETRSDGIKFNQAIPDFVIPQSYGRITDIRNYDSKQIVIDIQDLHCHAEVQRNISAILKTLDEKFGLDNVYVEGGYGKIDTSWLCGINDNKTRQEIVDGLVEQGRLTGSELYSVNSKRPEVLRGLEDEDLHKANIVRLGTILEKKALYKSRIGELSKDLETMKTRYFNLRNRRFNEVVERNRSQELTSDRYYKLLFKYVKKINADPDKFNNWTVTINTIIELIPLADRKIRFKLTKQKEIISVNSIDSILEAA